MKLSPKVKTVKSKDVQLQCACCPSALTYMGVTFNLQGNAARTFCETNSFNIKFVRLIAF